MCEQCYFARPSTKGVLDPRGRQKGDRRMTGKKRDRETGGRQEGDRRETGGRQGNRRETGGDREVDRREDRQEGDSEGDRIQAR